MDVDVEQKSMLTVMVVRFPGCEALPGRVAKTSKVAG
jgi:hypothetical protein